MKTFSRAMAALMFGFASIGFAQLSFDVDHGSLTLITNDGVWRKFATEFPIAGGWLSPGSPTGTSNGPNGDIWVFRYHDIHTSEGYGVYHTPITLAQYNDPSTINRTWYWGIYWVYGENKILEYGAFDYPYPEGFWDYSISYSAIVPEPDADGDGVPDGQDQCPNTPAGAVVDTHGCTIAQLVPCARPRSGGSWANHGQYVSAVVRTAEAFLLAGLITDAEKDAIVKAAGQSDCGRKPR